MNDLILSILFSTGNHLIFKAITRFSIQLPLAVCTNYGVCVCLGLFSLDPVFSNTGALFEQPWFGHSILQGGLLFASFMFIGLTTKHHGVSVSGLSSRLAVAIPTLSAFFLYQDTAGSLKLIGIGLAFASLYLSCKGDNGATTLSPSASAMFLPSISFLFFGMHTTLLKFVQNSFLSEFSYHAYVMASFLSAFAVSVLYVSIGILKGDLKINGRAIGAGITLGIANYCAVYFLIRTLGIPGWQSSRIFPTISIGVVLFSSLGAWLIFKEKIRKQMRIAIAIGVLAIALINF